MKIITCPSIKAAAEKTRQTLKDFLLSSKKSTINAFLPTGRTPRGFYELLVEEKKFWAPKIIPLQIDEFVDRQRLFFRELKSHLLSPLGIEKQGHYIDPLWTDAQMGAHVERVTALGVDVALLGLGPNGHIGFHEPGLGADFVGGRVMVSDETKNRVADAVTNETLTFGAGTFLKASLVILLATGKGKKEVFEKFLDLAPSPEVPATLLKNHHNFFVITDFK